MKTRIHKNSLKAYASLNLEPIERAVLRTYNVHGVLADRQTGRFHYSREVSIQPRITYLLNKKMLKEVGNTKCSFSGRTVRICKITSKGIKALTK